LTQILGQPCELQVAAAAPTTPATASWSRGAGAAAWFIAKGYDATYDCSAPPCVKAEPQQQASAEACEAACAKAPKCTVFAWSTRSKDCWFRTDAVWGAPGTLHPYGAVSGCKTGADPVTGNPYVKGCGAVPPLGPAKPTAPTRYMYGGGDNNIAGPRMVEATASVLPMLNRIDPAADVGLSLVQSPEDTPIVAWAGAAPGAGRGQACHYMIQPLVELYGGCMVVLKVSWCGIRRG
jgi:hypothetical protein